MGRKINVKHGSHLLEYLYEVLAPQSRTKTKSLLTGGRILVNGSPVRAFDLEIKDGDCIEIADRPAAAMGMSGCKNSKRTSHLKGVVLIYEDEHIIVAEKNCGLPSISTGKEGEITAYSVLTDYVRECGGNRVFIVHRLDRETSGLLLFAKDEKTKRCLQDNWNELVLERKYAGVAEGRFDRREGMIVSWLKEHPKSLKMSSSLTDNGGKKAITHYRVLKQTASHAFLEIELETGRKNQIRVQLSSIGHPLAGDKKYGASSNPFSRLALHARTLSFIHPYSDEVMRFESKVPFDF